MSREEVEKILSEGTTNPRYKVALDIAKQNGWVNDINTTDAKLPAQEENKEPSLIGGKLKNKLVMTPEEMQNMTSERTDVQNAIERSKGGNPATSKLDNMTGNITGLNDNPLKASDINADGSLTDAGKAKAVQNRLNNVGNDTGDTGSFQVGEESTETTEAKANAVAQPSKNDTPVETKAKNKYRNQSMSIWDAYYNGEFGEPGSDEAKATRNYFIVDAIANFAKNTGRSIGNIGAQYSGGTIDNGHDESKWEEIRNTLGGEELTVAKEQLGGPAERRATSELLQNKLSALSANRAATVNDLINEVKAAADSAPNETMKKSYLALAAMLSGANMNGVSLGATAATGLIEDIMNAIGGNK